MSRRLPKKARINLSTKKWYNPSEHWEKVESVQISKNCLDAYQKMVESVCVPKNGRIEASIEKIVSANNGKGSNECEYRKMVESRRVSGKGRIRASIEKIVSANNGMGSNECEYRKMVESRRVPGKGRIRASIEKVSGRVPKKGRISVSTEKL